MKFFNHKNRMRKAKSSKKEDPRIDAPLQLIHDPRRPVVAYRHQGSDDDLIGQEMKPS